jgi:hypothetical protein
VPHSTRATFAGAHHPRVRVGCLSNELARRLAGSGVTATSLHPGVVRTNFGADDQAWYFAVVSRVVRPLLKTPAQGAQTPIYLASSPDLDGVIGQFFANRKPKTANKVAYDACLTAKLWQVSTDLVGMTPATPLVDACDNPCAIAPALAERQSMA